MAIEAFLGKRKLEECIGTFEESNGALLLPLPHPSGVSRWLLDPAHQQLLHQALAILSQWRENLGL
jgi:uracil-DNA glycosylase